MAGCCASCTTIIAAIVIALLSPVAACFPTQYPQYRCATNAPAQNALTGLKSTTVAVGNRPWGVVYLNNDYAFAAVNFSIAVLDTSQFTPKLTTLIPFPEEDYGTMGNDDINSDGYGYRELTLSHDRQNLYVATGYGAVIIDVVRAIQGRNDSIVGLLSSDGYVGRSAIELSITPNDQYIFISQEFGSNNSHNRGAIEVFNVTRLDDGTVISSWRGFIALPGYATVGQQFSKDYTKLFVTSELNSTTSSPNTTSGVISVLDVAKLKHTPGKSLITKVSSGCRPVRCRLDGDRLWVSERDINHLTVFDAEKLANNDTTDLLLATVNTGTSPIGLAVVGQYVLTADSNRFSYANATTGITVVDSILALAGQVDFPQIPTGAFPRSLALSPNGKTLLVSEFGTGNIRAIDVSSLQ
ncbi:hypothetical protein SCUP234_01358 [Seiridium cupressi]